MGVLRKKEERTETVTVRVPSPGEGGAGSLARRDQHSGL